RSSDLAARDASMVSLRTVASASAMNCLASAMSAASAADGPGGRSATGGGGSASCGGLGGAAGSAGLAGWPQDAAAIRAESRMSVRTAALYSRNAPGGQVAARGEVVGDFAAPRDSRHGSRGEPSSEIALRRALKSRFEGRAVVGDRAAPRAQVTV